MEILEAYGVAGSLRGTAALAGCDYKTVAAGRGWSRRGTRLPVVLLGQEHEHLSILQREGEIRYVLSSRRQVGRRLTAEEEAR
jgi:hypothetical protein